MTRDTKPGRLSLTVITSLAILCAGCASQATPESGYPYPAPAATEVPKPDAAPVGSLMESLITEMEQVFSETQGMIRHTMTVRGHALEIMEVEGGDPVVVEGSAIMHDIGIPKAREVHGSSAGPYQEEEGPPIAREILSRYPVPAEKVDHICGIVANHHTAHDPAIVETIEFKILWDADWLVNFPGRHRDKTMAEKEKAIGEIFKTKKGEQLARQMFLE